MFTNQVPDLRHLDFWPIVCLVASEPIDTRRKEGFMYVQGCADDEESWARGLTPAMFWQNEHVLLGCSTERECRDTIDAIVQGAARVHSIHSAPRDEAIILGSGSDHFNFIGTTNVAVGDWSAGRPPDCWGTFDAVVNCTMNEHKSVVQGGSAAENNESKFRDDNPACTAGVHAALARHLHLFIPEGKRGAKRLGESLATALTFIRKHLCAGHKVLVHCAQGVDRSATVALAAMCAFFDDTGALLPVRHGGLALSPPEGLVTKMDVLQRQQWLLRSRQCVNPSRANMKALNTFFMSPPSPPSAIWADGDDRPGHGAIGDASGRREEVSRS